MRIHLSSHNTFWRGSHHSLTGRNPFPACSSHSHYHLDKFRNFLKRFHSSIFMVWKLHLGYLKLLIHISLVPKLLALVMDRTRSSTLARWLAFPSLPLSTSLLDFLMNCFLFTAGEVLVFYLPSLTIQQKKVVSSVAYALGGMCILKPTTEEKRTVSWSSRPGSCSFFSDTYEKQLPHWKSNGYLIHKNGWSITWWHYFQMYCSV